MIVCATGATAGFGLAIARRFARDNAGIIAVGRRGERLEELKNELGERLLPLTLDVGDRDRITRRFCRR
jgi:3-hydroxy acid dehydrogenase/malonic semialdehyde reductase